MSIFDVSLDESQKNEIAAQDTINVLKMGRMSSLSFIKRNKAVDISPGDSQIDNTTDPLNTVVNLKSVNRDIETKILNIYQNK